MKAAVFSCKGLGDGLVVLTLSHNLQLNNYIVDTYHNNLIEMQSWFENLPIKKYPDISKIDEILNYYDKIFVSYDFSNKFIMSLIEIGKQKFLDKIFVLNPCPSKKVGSQPYYEDTFFTPNLSVVDNILKFCKSVLHLKKVEKSNGIKNPNSSIFKKFSKRVVIHPSSAKESKNWPINSYMSLAKILKEKGYDPVFVISEKEKNDFQILEKNNFSLKAFSSLDTLSSFVFQSAYMIGNDSGIGHLASCIGLQTISIFRNHRSAKLWRPGFEKSKTIFPSPYIPNLSIFRLRDKYWKKFISLKKILKLFKNQDHN